VGVVPTITYPSHTTIVTGVAPSEHGVISNTTFDPLLKNHAGWYWYGQAIRAQTLWEAASRAGLTTASINWPVTVEARGVRYLIPEYWRAETEDDRRLIDQWQ
jgi:predicted AlkP superfamily pyrophosphatase or phosphodiesterase